MSFDGRYFSALCMGLCVYACGLSCDKGKSGHDFKVETGPDAEDMLSSRFVSAAISRNPFAGLVYKKITKYEQYWHDGSTYLFVIEGRKFDRHALLESVMAAISGSSHPIKVWEHEFGAFKKPELSRWRNMPPGVSTANMKGLVSSIRLRPEGDGHPPTVEILFATEDDRVFVVYY